MISMIWFARLAALVMVGLILWLIRRDRLPVSHSMWWLAVAGLIAVFGLFPQLIDRAADLVGIAYPPSLLFILALLSLTIKVLLEDLEVSVHRRRLLRLGQRLAMVEDDLQRLKEMQQQHNDPES